MYREGRRLPTGLVVPLLKKDIHFGNSVPVKERWGSVTLNLQSLHFFAKLHCLLHPILPPSSSHIYHPGGFSLPPQFPHSALNAIFGTYSALLRLRCETQCLWCPTLAQYKLPCGSPSHPFTSPYCDSGPHGSSLGLTIFILAADIFHTLHLDSQSLLKSQFISTLTQIHWPCPQVPCLISSRK